MEAFPQYCSLAEHLPKDANATFCERTGIFDFTVRFEADVTETGYAEYTKNLLNELRNPRISEGILNFDSQISYEADGNIWVGLWWKDGHMKVEYWQF